jgi:hypothetical protein
LIVIGCLSASILVASYLAYTTVWYFAIYAILPCGLSILGLLLGLVALSLLRLARSRKAGGLNTAGKVLLLAGLCLIVQLVYVPIALTLREWEVERTQAFIHSLIPRVEEYKRLHNGYPEHIDAILTDADTLPQLLQLKNLSPLAFDNRQQLYFQRGPTYGFQFRMPDGFIGFHYEYCCGADGSWTVTD